MISTWINRKHLSQRGSAGQRAELLRRWPWSQDCQRGKGERAWSLREGTAQGTGRQAASGCSRTSAPERTERGGRCGVAGSSRRAPRTAVGQIRVCVSTSVLVSWPWRSLRVKSRGPWMSLGSLRSRVWPCTPGSALSRFKLGDFPGGPEVRGQESAFQCGGGGLHPWLGSWFPTSRMP